MGLPSVKRFVVVRRHSGLAVLDRDTGLHESISSGLAGLLDMTKVDPLRIAPPTYVDPLPLKVSVERAAEVSRAKWQRKTARRR